MRFVDEYRAPEQVMQLIEHLRERAALLPYTAERPLRIMEVCGGHTHAIFKFGLDQLLPENVEFIHGPVVRSACCQWDASTVAWKSPAIRR
ncbi:hydrogenase isoenzymes formation protein HypD [Salmonella enterica subsp. enterica]|nr:hydrogenase isoenzymes formation protein HypD [Salmonella enterica subsp. enterica]